jgi:hypothetical protein
MAGRAAEQVGKTELREAAISAGDGWHADQCDRCPLAFELGGYVVWDSGMLVRLKQDQVICTCCGTMPAGEERGFCRVTAQPGPLPSGQESRNRSRESLSIA